MYTKVELDSANNIRVFLVDEIDWDKGSAYYDLLNDIFYLAEAGRLSENDKDVINLIIEVSKKVYQRSVKAGLV